MSLRYRLWDLWIPDYEGVGPWHLRWRAWLMWQVRRLWFRGKTVACMCDPSCDEQVPKASASGLCHDCLNEDCQHDLDFSGPESWPENIR